MPGQADKDVQASTTDRSDVSRLDTGGPLGELLGEVFGILLRRGRSEFERVASTSRVRLELRQLKKDRGVMYQKLGREVRTLVEGGEIEHPGLARGVERIAELDRRITQVETNLVTRGSASAEE